MHALQTSHPSIHPSSYRRDHDQPEQEADDTDEEQQQLPAVPPPHLLGVQVGHRRHQGLQAHELGDKTGGVVLPIGLKRLIRVFRHVFVRVSLPVYPAPA